MRKSIFLALVLLAGCSLAPDFNPPKITAPSVFKEDVNAKDAAAWKPAEALDTKDRGAWWKVFNDKTLDAFEEQAAAANQSLKAAAARVQEARAAARAGTNDILPNITIGGNAVRAESSAASLQTPQPTRYTLFDARGGASYEPDLFGRIRSEHTALLFGASAQEADYRSVLLSLQADVAQDYFGLNALDDEEAVLRNAVKIRAEAARIMKQRVTAGVAGEQDVSNALTDLESARAELTSVERQRAGVEHALAVLLGKMPSEFNFADQKSTAIPPRVPPGVPSALLQRRPDIAASFDMMAAENERIGAARAAFFPDLSLTATGGFESAALGDLFRWSARTWALGQVAGLALTLPIFDNGRHSAELDGARASYDEAVANYRQQVLVAFRDVEDALAGQRLYARQLQEADAASNAAARTLKLTQKRYQEGDAEYFEVVEADRTSLAASRAAVETKGQRMIAAVTLIRALGGGW